MVDGTVGDETHDKRAVEFLERQLLVEHPFPDGVDRAFFDFGACLDAVFLQLFHDGGDEAAHFAHAAFAHIIQTLADVIIDGRVGVFQGQVFQLDADGMKSQTVGERCIEIGCLRGDFQLLVFGHRVEGAHVVQPVAELDEHHAHIVGQRRDDFLEVLGLHTLGTIHFVEFGEAVHNARHLFAKHLGDVVQGVLGVFHHVVQQGANDGSTA